MSDLDRIRNRIRGELEEIIAHHGGINVARAEVESFSMWLEWLEIREKGKAYANAN